jgi:hypothetical protein
MCSPIVLMDLPSPFVLRRTSMSAGAEPQRLVKLVELCLAMSRWGFDGKIFASCDPATCTRPLPSWHDFHRASITAFTWKAPRLFAAVSFLLIFLFFFFFLFFFLFFSYSPSSNVLFPWHSILLPFLLLIGMAVSSFCVPVDSYQADLLVIWILASSAFTLLFPALYLLAWLLYGRSSLEDLERMLCQSGLPPPLEQLENVPRL